ncbi:phosphonate C-P lyase system protein PhnG [Thermus thermophilus]|uniref:phosphonate C-P lyase system protein PhnG n=1 Tax=Thermus thermophilus TaxID=274 RepID=UPI001FCD495A|nr:phosphonate C-P lyase system protein PhnG [Thermus thermophilus]BDG29804.1 hypothetical protein TthSNM76_20140 [Thermus thermophilus]
MVVEPLEALGHLAQAPVEALERLVRQVRGDLGKGVVLREGPALLPLPFRDGRRGGLFYLGEALVYECWLRFPERGVEGYGLVLGEDREKARALATLDAALAAGVGVEAILEGARASREAREAEDEALWKKVNRTRLEVETL